MKPSTLTRILEAGIEVFAQAGPLAGGTLEIAKKAGVAESTIFRRFENKENLFRECFRTSLARSLDPSQFRSLIWTQAAETKDGFAQMISIAMKRWYESMPVAAARLVLFTSLLRNRQWHNLGTDRINEIVAALAERVAQEAGKRSLHSPDAKLAATSLIANLLYHRSIAPSGHKYKSSMVDTCIQQWLFGIFPRQLKDAETLLYY